MSSGLALHDRLASSSMKPFHDRMVTMFARMRESIETGVAIEVCFAAYSNQGFHVSLFQQPMLAVDTKSHPSELDTEELLSITVISHSHSPMQDDDGPARVPRSTYL